MPAVLSFSPNPQITRAPGPIAATGRIERAQTQSSPPRRGGETTQASSPTRPSQTGRRSRRYRAARRCRVAARGSRRKPRAAPQRRREGRSPTRTGTVRLRLHVPDGESVQRKAQDGGEGYKRHRGRGGDLFREPALERGERGGADVHAIPKNRAQAALHLARERPSRGPRGPYGGTSRALKGHAGPRAPRPNALLRRTTWPRPCQSGKTPLLMDDQLANRGSCRCLSRDRYFSYGEA